MVDEVETSGEIWVACRLYRCVRHEKDDRPHDDGDDYKDGCKVTRTHINTLGGHSG